VIHTTTERFPGKDRISTTFSIIANAQSQVFFLQGSNKLRVWQEMVDAKTDYIRYLCVFFVLDCEVLPKEFNLFVFFSWPAHRVLETGRTTSISSEH
jgi:hypothetical protein